jgi:hypothetical protein
MMMINIVIARRIFLFLLLLLSIGCGSSSRSAVHPTSGQVLVGGKPATHARIVLHPVSETGTDLLRPTGTIGPDGSFRLTSYAQDDGAPAGEYAVTITWFLAVPKKGTDETETRNFLPVRYARPETSRLRATIQPGSNELPAFLLDAR